MLDEGIKPISACLNEFKHLEILNLNFSKFISLKIVID